MTERAVWTPTPEIIQNSNIQWLMDRVGAADYQQLHRWSVENRSDYWRVAVERLGIRLRQPVTQMLDISDGVDQARWMVGGKWNIVDSCFDGPLESPAIIYQRENQALRTMTLGELQELTARVAAGLIARGIEPGDAVAMLMPMTPIAVAIYLGIIQCGAVAVGIAESFSSPEIALRLQLGRVKLVFATDVLQRGGKSHELFAKLIDVDAPPTVVVPADECVVSTLRDIDSVWDEFLDHQSMPSSVACHSDHPIGVLFSSGTTGEPKAIPWTNTCPLKCAADAHFHQDIHPGDVLAWPTSMGWMMGPWLVFASLLNRSAMALYDGLPTTKEFASFIEHAGVSMLGVVPRLVASWRSEGCLEGSDWSGIKAFSSTGECSVADDVRWLIQKTNGGPMIEYCGGTEIAGGYITGTVTQPCIPATFSTPALGVNVVILDGDGQRAKHGELYLVPPSIGLSSTLLNRDHDEVYYAGCPRGPNDEVLRRHGDEMEFLSEGYWRAHGRVDDTMNLSGIKVSSVEIERAIGDVEGVIELAAISELPRGGGVSQLVIYAVVVADSDTHVIQQQMQTLLCERLNPLFKIERVEFVGALPRTASNKIIRRQLRNESSG
jgi:acetyl-CoA synthetase